MLPIGRLPESAGRDVVLGRDDADAVLAYCRAMGTRFGCPHYQRYLFGLPIDEALRAGYLITQRGLRETAPHACAEETARRALGLASCLDSARAEAPPSVLDIFAGVGQVAFSYAGAGCRVRAVDNDPTTVEVAIVNVTLAGRDGLIVYGCADGPATLASAADGTRGFTIVHLDPPWRGNYQYDLTLPFALEDLSVDVAQLVQRGLDAGTVVVLDLPHNVVSAEVRDLAAQVPCQVLVQYQYVADFPAQFGQAHAFFFHRSASGRGPTADYDEQRQHLTISGKRINSVG